MLDDLTIIIPTHNRHDYLERALELYSPFNIQIIIADSSPNQFSRLNDIKSNIIYKHTPTFGQIKKWKNALLYVKTKYVVFCPDDDFIFPAAIEKCVEFLEENSDFVCSEGVLLTYKYIYSNKSIIYNISNDDLNLNQQYNDLLSVDGDTIEDRLEQYCQPYRHSIYGVHRTENLLNIFSTIHASKVVEPYLFELSQAILTVISGKIATFNFLYYFREAITTSGGYICKNVPALVREDNFEIQMLKSMVENHLVSNYAKKNTRQKLSQLFLNKYLEFAQHYKHQPSLNVSSKRTKNNFKYKHLEDRYNSQKYLLTVENSILKHDIYSGFNFEDNDERIKTSKAINSFHKEIETLFNKLISSQKKVVIYGAGVCCEIICAMYPQKIEFIIDKNTSKVGKKINGIDIYPQTKLSESKDIYDCILISVLGREEEIIHSLKNELKNNKEILTINC
jgi:glycosyltransferase domain-containing protein